MKNSTTATLGFGCLLASLTFAGRTEAHFKLNAPASFQAQDGLGDPQKLAPCGGPGTATGTVTTYKAGDTISVSLDETIFHPGHYRVTLGKNGVGDLPTDPPVKVGATACGSTVVQSPAVYPVLVDGALEHTTSFNGTQTISVKLPADVTCTNCTLQVLEFMSSHGAPCFYHHCATISITGPDGGAPPADAGATDSGAGPVDASTDASKPSDGGSNPLDAGNTNQPAIPDDSGGCGVSSTSQNGAGLTLFSIAAFGIASVIRRRRSAR